MSGQLHVIDNANNGVIDRDKGDGHRLRRFPAAHNEDQFVWPSLKCGVGGNNRLALRLLRFAQGLHHQEFDPLQTFIFLGGDHRADNAC